MLKSIPDRSVRICIMAYFYSSGCHAEGVLFEDLETCDDFEVAADTRDEAEVCGLTR